MFKIGEYRSFDLFDAAAVVTAGSNLFLLLVPLSGC